jgi:hypothetical protein
MKQRSMCGSGSVTRRRHRPLLQFQPGKASQRGRRKSGALAHGDDHLAVLQPIDQLLDGSEVSINHLDVVPLPHSRPVRAGQRHVLVVVQDAQAWRHGDTASRPRCHRANLMIG